MKSLAKKALERTGLGYYRSSEDEYTVWEFLDELCDMLREGQLDTTGIEISDRAVHILFKKLI